MHFSRHLSSQNPAELLTFLQHAHFQTLHEAARLAGLASSFGDLALIGGRTAVLDVTWRETKRREREALLLLAVQK